MHPTSAKRARHSTEAAALGEDPLWVPPPPLTPRVAAPAAAPAFAVADGSSSGAAAAGPLGSPGSPGAIFPGSPKACGAQKKAFFKDSRQSGLTPEQKVLLILQRHSDSFCEELGINMQQNGSASLWQWFCAAVLFSARIKSNAALHACKALFKAGLTSPQAFGTATQDGLQDRLHSNGYDRYDEKAAGFLLEDARLALQEYGGDLNQLREAAGRNPAQERALLKKLKGVGDGAVDIFFREVQLVWEELFPFADKKALKAARLVGLKEHPQALAELCGNDKAKYVRLIAALVRIELTKTYSEF